MNLCLSGFASCYVRSAHPAVLREAAQRIRSQHPGAVTLNEACSRDAGDLARRTGYRERFAAVLVRGTRLRCVAPGHRGLFGIAVLTTAPGRADSQPFSAQAGSEERRWLCVATNERHTVCTAHLGTRGSASERDANDAQCVELRSVLAGYDEGGTTMFGGDLNRDRFCAPSSMWSTSDTGAGQKPGIQHVYGSSSVPTPTVRVTTATHTDHDFLLS